MGRKTILDELDHKFRDRSDITDSPVTVVVHGLGGQGKTQLALEYCRRSRESHRFNNIVWIRAGSWSAVLNSFELLAPKMVPNLKTKDPESIMLAVVEVMARWQVPWLMVLDNLDTLETFKATQIQEISM